MIYEHRALPPLSRRAYVVRLLRHGGYILVLLAASEIIGISGYHWFAHAPWIDALLNASMLLGGMGPVGEITNAAGKLFASFFALYSGLVFLIAMALFLTPVLHRMVHHFHWDADQAAERH